MVQEKDSIPPLTRLQIQIAYTGVNAIAGIGTFPPYNAFEVARTITTNGGSIKAQYAKHGLWNGFVVPGWKPGMGRVMLRIMTRASILPHIGNRSELEQAVIMAAAETVTTTPPAFIATQRITSGKEIPFMNLVKQKELTRELYRGSLPVFIGQLGFWGICFSTQNNVLSLLRGNNNPEKSLTTKEACLIALITGAIDAGVSIPTEMIRIKQQSANASTSEKSFTGNIKQTFCNYEQLLQTAKKTYLLRLGASLTGMGPVIASIKGHQFVEQYLNEKQQQDKEKGRTIR